MKYMQVNRVIRKVRQTQHWNPEFCHTRVRFNKKPEKKTLTFKGGGETQKAINFGG